MPEGARVPDAPETLQRFTSPAAILERLDVIRMRYTMGDIDTASFNEVLKLFQFRDVHDVLWTPGAQSGTWYRWAGERWIPGAPPEQLVLPPLTIKMLPEAELEPQPLSKWAPAKDPNIKTCPKCGAENTAKKFCTSCGAKLV
jgi:hypothetical protein